MCKVMKRYEEIAVRKANINAVKNMIKVFGATEEQILQIYTKEEYERAVKELDEEQLGNK